MAPRREGWYDATIRLGHALFRALDVRRRWHGLEHLPRTGPVLLATNHISFPDFLFVGEAALERDRLVRFLCRHDMWDQPLVGRAMDGMRHVPVDRAAPAHAYLRARALLRAGEAVCVFPEAGISHSYTIRSLMPGVASLARETGVPVVPVVSWGQQRLWPVRRRVGEPAPRPDPRRGVLVDVSFGEPFSVPVSADLVTTTTELGHRLTALLEDLQSRPEHCPRPGERARWHPAHLGGTAPTREQARGLDLVPRSAVAPTWGPVAGQIRPAATSQRLRSGFFSSLVT